MKGESLAFNKSTSERKRSYRSNEGNHQIPQSTLLRVSVRVVVCLGEVAARHCCDRLGPPTESDGLGPIRTTLVFSWRCRMIHHIFYELCFFFLFLPSGRHCNSEGEDLLLLLYCNQASAFRNNPQQGTNAFRKRLEVQIQQYRYMQGSIQ